MSLLSSELIVSINLLTSSSFSSRWKILQNLNISSLSIVPSDFFIELIENDLCKVVCVIFNVIIKCHEFDELFKCNSLLCVVECRRRLLEQLLLRGRLLLRRRRIVFKRRSHLLMCRCSWNITWGSLILLLWRDTQRRVTCT